MAYRTNRTFKNILSDLNFTTGLELCLDAGDAASYTSGTKWLDVQNGFDFFLGSDATATNDPVFTGVAGSLDASTYFLFPSAAYFRYDSANEAWMENIHKDNAKFTLACWFYIGTGTLGTTHALAGTTAGGTGTGFYWDIRNSDLMGFEVDAGGVAQLFKTGVNAAKEGWNFFALSMDEAASNLILHVNGVNETISVNYIAPSAGAALATMEICALGNGVLTTSGNDRMGAFFAWSRALSGTELMSLYQYPNVVFSDFSGIRHRTQMVGY